MPDKKITELSDATTLDGTEYFVVVQSGSDKKVTLASLASYFGSSVGSTSYVATYLSSGQY